MTPPRAAPTGVRALALALLALLAPRRLRRRGCAERDALRLARHLHADGRPDRALAVGRSRVDRGARAHRGPRCVGDAGPTRTPDPTPRPSGTAGPAAACTGSAENRAFYASVAEDVAWDVYCPVLPAGWFVDAGTFRLAGGGRLEIDYKGPAGARLEIRQGAYCRGDDDCIPAGPDAGTASFGGRPARLIDVGDGRWLVVAEGGDVNWEVLSSGLSRDVAVALRRRLRPRRPVGDVAGRRVVRERIDPRLTAALFSNYRSPIDAVLELVDNAVDSRAAGRPLDLDLAVQPGRLTVTAVGGTGMGPAAIERDYLRWGASTKRAGDQIGRYGQGGKAAIGHLGNRFEIVASAAGDEHAVGFEDPAYRDRGRLRTYELHPRRKPVAADLGYVRIEIGEMDRTIDARRLRDRLSETYRPLLEADVVRIAVNRAPVTPRPWSLAERHEIAVRAGGRIVHGWWGLLQDPPSPGAPGGGVRLYHLGRLVGPPEWSGHPTPAAHPALNRLVGAVELPHVAVTMNKADVDRGTATWAAVEAQAARAAAVPGAPAHAGAGVQRDAGGAADGGPGATDPGEGAAAPRGGAPLRVGGRRRGRGAGGPAGSGGGPHAGGGASRRGRRRWRARRRSRRGSPATPPARGRGRRRGDGTTAWCRGGGRAAAGPAPAERLVEEDGIRRVVINSAYPLYELRRGDLWYQLGNGPPRGLRDHPRGDRPRVRAEGQRADARLARPGRTAATWDEAAAGRAEAPGRPLEVGGPVC